MAKIKTLGDAVVVVSTLKFEDIKFLEKYREDALALKGGEDNKEIIFRVGASGTPGANKYGITFEGATRDEAKQAILTLSLNYEGEDIKGYIADQLRIPSTSSKYALRFNILSNISGYCFCNSSFN